MTSMAIMEPFFHPPLAVAERVKGRRMRDHEKPRSKSPMPVRPFHVSELFRRPLSAPDTHHPCT